MKNAAMHTPSDRIEPAVHVVPFFVAGSGQIEIFATFAWDIHQQNFLHAQFYIERCRNEYTTIKYIRNFFRKLSLNFASNF